MRVSFINLFLSTAPTCADDCGFFTPGNAEACEGITSRENLLFAKSVSASCPKASARARTKFIIDSVCTASAT